MLTLQAVETGGASQTTKWIYGVTTTGGSDVNSNDILATVQYPDPTTGSPSSSYQESYKVNALGDSKTYTDRAGNVHTYALDILGRVTSDAITTLATGFDGSVRRIQTAYDTQANPYLITSYDAATAGNIVNQVQRAYNGLGQMSQEWQSHSGAVNTGTTPSVQYGYTLMSGGANNSRLTSMTYPNGKVLNYNYATGLDDTISRLTSLSDNSGTLESYSYLGLDTVVQRARSQISTNLAYIKQTGESNGDAGDQYTGLDRFGRVVDQRWLNTGTGTATDRFQYGYDRDSNALYRNNLVNNAFGELYHASGAGNAYDNLNQLSGFLRGVLSASGGSGTPLDTISSASSTESWSPDALGNFTSVTLNGTQTNRTNNQQNELTAVGSSTLAFDNNGNLITDEQGRTLVYDAWNRLVAVKSGSTTLASYAFDGLGRRIQETASGSTRDLFFDSWNVIEERISGTTKVQYIWSPFDVNSLILRDRDADGNSGNGLEERLWVQQDANKNITALVNSSGTVVERYTYDPFGQVTYLTASFGSLSSSAYDWRVLFQGERLDPAVNQYNMDHRVYLPTIQRWANPDPKGYAAGDNDLYRFVSDNAVNRIDPTGLDEYPDSGEGTLTAVLQPLPKDPPKRVWLKPGDVGPAGEESLPGIFFSEVKNGWNNTWEGFKSAPGDAINAPYNLMEKWSKEMEEFQQKTKGLGGNQTIEAAGPFLQDKFKDLGNYYVGMIPFSGLAMGGVEWYQTGDPTSYQKAAGNNAFWTTVAAGASILGGLEPGAGRPNVGPGPFAGESIPARSPAQVFTPAERAGINQIGEDTGCHSCGRTDPGTKSGNFVPDHQPPSALNPTNGPQRLYPQCIDCSRAQGLAIARWLRGQE